MCLLGICPLPPLPPPPSPSIINLPTPMIIMLQDTRLRIFGTHRRYMDMSWLYNKINHDVMRLLGICWLQFAPGAYDGTLTGKSSLPQRNQFWGSKFFYVKWNKIIPVSLFYCIPLYFISYSKLYLRKDNTAEDNERAPAVSLGWNLSYCVVILSDWFKF